MAVDLDDVAVDSGHAELVYDFRDGGEADGWLHALFRYEDRQSGHVAESSFGAHIFNTAMTYRDEPQSYSGPPPGLSTTLFLKLGDARAAQFRGADLPGLRRRGTRVRRPRCSCMTAPARQIAERDACRSPAPARPWCGRMRCSARRRWRAAGPDGYVLVRDPTCRLFGYHGLMDDAGGFSLDHMFGF